MLDFCRYPLFLWKIFGEWHHADILVHKVQYFFFCINKSSSVSIKIFIIVFNLVATKLQCSINIHAQKLGMIMRWGELPRRDRWLLHSVVKIVSSHSARRCLGATLMFCEESATAASLVNFTLIRKGWRWDTVTLLKLGLLVRGRNNASHVCDYNVLFPKPLTCYCNTKHKWAIRDVIQLQGIFCQTVRILFW